MCSALAPRRHWKSFGAAQVHLSVCCSSSYSVLSVMPSRWSPSTCPVEFLLICGIFRNRPPERSVIHYTVRACDVPPNNAATLTVAEPRPKSPNRPSQGLPHSCHNCPIPQSTWKLSQPQKQRACPPPLPDQLAAAASAVFSLQTQKSRCRQLRAAETAWRAGSWCKWGPRHRHQLANNRKKGSQSLPRHTARFPRC